MNTNFEDATTPLRRREWYDKDASWKAKKIYEILNNNGITPKSVCEIGCGAGDVLVNLFTHFNSSVTFTGYETAQEGYEICRQEETESIHFYNKDLLKEDAFFDVVMAINVFTHVRDYLGFLSKLRRRGEYKIFHIPLHITIYTVLRSRYMQNKDYMLGHLHHFNKETALGTLQGTGYQIIDYFYTSRYVDMPDLPFRYTFWKLLAAINQDFAAKLLGGFNLMVLTK